MDREIITGRGKPWGYAGRLVPVEGRRALDYVAAFADRLRPVYERAEFDVRDFAIAPADDVWRVLQKWVEDRELAEELAGALGGKRVPWHAGDREDLVRLLRRRPLTATRTTFWTFARGTSRLIGSVLEHRDWTDVVVDRDCWQYRRERFPRYNRVPASARATALAVELRRTSWKEMGAA